MIINIFIQLWYCQNIEAYLVVLLVLQFSENLLSCYQQHTVLNLDRCCIQTTQWSEQQKLVKQHVGGWYRAAWPSDGDACLTEVVSHFGGQSACIIQMRSLTKNDMYRYIAYYINLTNMCSPLCLALDTFYFDFVEHGGSIEIS